jgi:hypothetical protein
MEENQNLHGRVKRDQSDNPRGDIFIAASRGPEVIRVIWSSRLLAHCGRRRRLARFRWRFWVGFFICRTRIHKRRKFVGKSFVGFLFCLTETKRQEIKRSISKGMATCGVDIVQSAEVFKHPVTEAYIVAWLTAKKTTLLFFQS